MTGEGAVEQIVIKAVQRSLGLPTVSGRHMRIEPIQMGSRVPACSTPCSWEGLAAFTQLRGTFRVIGRLHGGRDSKGADLAESPPIIE